MSIGGAMEGHIYYDLKLANPSRPFPLGDGKPIPFSVKDNTSRILTKQNDYKMAITGFQLDLDIPIMVVPIEEGITQTDLNATLYNIAIRQNDKDGNEITFERKNVVFVPENDKTNLPRPPSLNGGIQDITTDYYTYQSYQSFLDIINTTIADLIDAVPAWKTLFDPAKAGDVVKYPVIELAGDIFQIRYSGAWVSDATSYNTDQEKFIIEFNAPLKHLFSGFKYTRKDNGTNYGDNHSYYTLNLKDNENSGAGAIQGAEVITGESLNSILLLKQEYDTRYRFNSISSLVITSDYIKVRPEYYPTIANPNQVNDINSNFNTPFRNIISSFSIVEQGGDITWQEQQYYIPSVYKYIDLTSSDALDVIDARVFYQFKRGGLVPATIPVGSQSTIKFLFRQKTASTD